MLRSKNGFGILRAATAAATLAVATTANAQIIPQPVCVDFDNNDFSIGSAFWSVNQELGGWGDSFGGIFTSFTPLSLVGASQGNVATFFTEAAADGECESPLGSDHNTQFTLARTLTPVPSSGRLTFKFGAQVSYVLVNQSAVRYKIQLIVRNLSTGQQAKCVLAEDKDGANSNQAFTDTFIVPFQKFDPCNCEELIALPYAPGDILDIAVIGVVEAAAERMGDSAFIGGPFFFDDFLFCNILCPIIADPPVELEQLGFPSPPKIDHDLSNLDGATARELALSAIDADADQTIDPAEWEQHAISIGGVPTIDRANPDINRDGTVDQNDVDLMIGMVNNETTPTTAADLNADAVIDGADFEILLDALLRPIR